MSSSANSQDRYALVYLGDIASVPSRVILETGAGEVLHIGRAPPVENIPHLELIDESRPDMPMISRCHAKLRFSDQGLELQHFGYNGSAVNGRDLDANEVIAVIICYVIFRSMSLCCMLPMQESKKATF